MNTTRLLAATLAILFAELCAAPVLAQSAPALPTNPAELDSEHNTAVCPTKDFPLDVALPKTAQPEVFLDPTTMWQPRGGEIKIAIRNWPGALNQSSFAVCFRWRHLDPVSYTHLTLPTIYSV